MKVLKGLASALEYLNSRGVIHRDIKCANILVAQGAVVKLADFGLSKTFDFGESSRAHTLVGTLNYIAPEVSKGEYTIAVDMFSLGRPSFSLWFLSIRMITSR